ncbi:DUF2243 domain-containing protein [Paenibacillus caseinilyticus]|uniref:DUF2243 domain-containing protein n=1 Tax=Paenibacillus mucilaginosus K02 TaxID=997761 RepID=I0BAJ5_9BACL|nr:DUF2243 domain-containing protein [Paenibacillus mucilaginosus]AFH59392.1 hypothetical protein B2K_01395 [Paenibacillus mucilaginosus K02]
MNGFWHDLRHHPTLLGAFLLGIGTIGMLDGIIFHQLLQWHSVNMHTDRQHQIISDGLFHLAVTVVMVWGAVVLWNSGRADEPGARKLFLSGLFTGAGLFNFVEGIINHHVLQLHHVHPGDYQTAYDLAYDASGLLLLLVGLVLYRSSQSRAR